MKLWKVSFLDTNRLPYVSGESEVGREPWPDEYEKPPVIGAGCDKSSASDRPKPVNDTCYATRWRPVSQQDLTRIAEWVWYSTHNGPPRARVLIQEWWMHIVHDY